MDNMPKAAAAMLFALICAFVVAGALFNTYFLEGGPITVGNYTFRRGASDSANWLTELEFGALTINAKPVEGCLKRAENVARVHARLIRVKGETVMATAGLTRIVIRCLPQQNLVLIYGASSDLSELDNIINSVSRSFASK